VSSNEDEHSSSLLRRLINEDRETRTPEDDLPEPKSKPASPGGIISPIPGMTSPAQPSPARRGDSPARSPIRPRAPDTSELPHQPLLPGQTDPVQALTPREQMQRAEEALINLREKTARLAAEFAEGKLNQAQFDAVYGRYSEQRDITERLLTRNPESQAWQSVVKPGHTGFLKQMYEARVISYAIYDQETAEQISTTGAVLMKPLQIKAVLARLRAVAQTRGNPGPAQKKLADDERSVLFVPGEQTVAVVIFSLTPSPSQIERIKDIHRDFERANQHTIRQRDYAISRMVFPHRALFEEKKH